MSTLAQPPTYDATTTAATGLTPYLQLSHLLSLTWLAYPILSLIFVAFRLQLSMTSLEGSILNVKSDILSSCKAAEHAATAAASMPRYMALATNEQFVDAVNGSLGAARVALVLSLTAMEAIINFIIDTYRSTFFCFLELVVTGGLAILISAVQEINTVLQSVTSSLRTSIQSDIASANSVIQNAINAINKVNPFGNINAPQIAIPSLDALQNVTLPSSFQDALTSLNASIPSVADLKGALESIIDTPFELLKQDINDTFTGLSFNSSILPVPEQNRLSFCNGVDLSVVDDLGRDFIKIAKIGVVLIILLALLLVGLNCLLTWYKWRCMKRHLEYTRQAWITDPTMIHTKSSSSSPPQVTLSDHNLMMLQANSSHPLITRIMNQLSALLRLSPSHHTNLRWFLHYIFHAPALACFLIGFFGLLSVEIQLLAMGPIVHKFEDRAASAVSDFSNVIAASINDSMYNQSALYANDINSLVDDIQSTINNGVFGWVNGTTVTLNATINAFYTDIQNAVSTVFNGTVLENPANEFIKCFIGGKVDAIENALTFLHDNLQIDIPRVNDSILVLSPASVNEATAPIAAAAIGGGPNDKEGLIGRLVNSYTATLKKERVMFGLFLALWGIVVLMGVCILIWNTYGRALLKNRRRRRYELEQRSGIKGIVVPFRSGVESGNEKGAVQDLPSFTPLPSPSRSAFKPFWASRSNSPIGNQPSGSAESFGIQKEGWDDFPPKPIESSVKKPSRLMAIGRKAIGKERVKANGGEESTSSLSEKSPPDEEIRSTTWFGNFMTLWTKKEPMPQSSEFWDQPSRGRPKLQINVHRDSADAGPNPYGSHAMQSRWSASPDATQMSWKNVMSPSKKTSTTTTATFQTPNGFSTRKHDVPSHNTNQSYDSFSSATLKSGAPASLPLPLYHGFSGSRSRSSARADATTTERRDSSPPPPFALYRTGPPFDGHRRSSTLRVMNPSFTSSDYTVPMPASRLLTTTDARYSSPTNPFITPFDDEHRVTIEDNPIDARQSIATNPFVVAL
ncbi:hypothetical protein K443DRAFT_671297 [Laccaria amethystina LaAM-08-1]|uniref:Plasma membrane fusion protein PRM1 n=1 Tax=Laccaria amethystina LaAM-08-1 TaxID=1095629 RepID=A0A0C9XCM2_9AGAR|nr:hypothetical protein K443DRAFT_671297 [Laccaria amethystina LaAM-08-1]